MFNSTFWPNLFFQSIKLLFLYPAPSPPEVIAWNPVRWSAQAPPFMSQLSLTCQVLSVQSPCLVPKEARRGRQIPWNWSCRWLWTMWVLGIELWSSGKNSRAISAARFFSFCSVFWRIGVAKVRIEWKRLLHVAVTEWEDKAKLLSPKTSSLVEWFFIST